MSEIALVELHDARLVKLLLTPTEGLTIVLSNVSIYKAAGVPDTFDIWSCEGKLEVRKWSRMLFEREVPTDGWISDMRVTVDPGTSTPELVSLLKGIVARDVSIVFNNGATIAIENAYAQLTLGTQEFLESWQGPL